MHILEHPNTDEVFSFDIKHPDLILIKKDGEEYREEQAGMPMLCYDNTDKDANGFYSLRIARKIWEALASQGFTNERIERLNTTKGNVTINGKPSSVSEISKKLKGMMAE